MIDSFPVNEPYSKLVSLLRLHQTEGEYITKAINFPSGFDVNVFIAKNGLGY